jgi:hypothetical protein
VGGLRGNDGRVEKTVEVREVRHARTRGGAVRFVLVDADGDEYTTFRERIGEAAERFEGKRARIEFHEEERNGFRNVYLDKIAESPEPAEEEHEGDPAEEAAWQTAVEAAPYLVGQKRKLEPDELYDALKPFKDRVAEDIRDG